MKTNDMKKGFTLIETLVAITILIVGVLGPLTIAVRGISDGFFARNQIAANYLAQEAVEVIFNKRQTNCLYSGGALGQTLTVPAEMVSRGLFNLVFAQGEEESPPPPAGEPLGGLESTCQGSNIWRGIIKINRDCEEGRTCRVDVMTTDLVFCLGDGCKLVFDTNKGYYWRPDEVVNPLGPVFERTIKLTRIPGNSPDPNNPDGVQVTVLVTWDNFSLPRELQLIYDLYRY